MKKEVAVDARGKLLAELGRRVTERAEERLYAWLDDCGEVEQRLTYAQVWSRVQAIGKHLQGITSAGDRVVLCYAFGLDFIQVPF